MRKIQILLALVLLPSLIPRVAHFVPDIHPTDFDVYYTASTLVREHQGPAIYSGADTGVDPQLRSADPGTVFARRAQQLGIDNVRLYVYPPVLADALIPISLAPAALAEKAWTAVTLAGVLAVALLLANLMPIPAVGFAGLTLLVALLASQPVVSDLSWGQITVMLLLLWTLGIWLYRRGWLGPSAALFALATAIKLTPLIVIVPFLIWREWKWLRSYALALIAIVAIMALINSPATLSDYVFHVIPSMSGGVAQFLNESIPASIQLLFLAATGKPIAPVEAGSIPALLLTVGKVASLMAILISVFLVWRASSAMPKSDRILALALFALLSAAVAPVSWRHAYAVGLPALALLWSNAFRGGRLNARVFLLAVCTVAVTSYLNQWAFQWLIHAHWQVAAALAMMLLPLSAVILVLVELSQMGSRRDPAAEMAH